MQYVAVIIQATLFFCIYLVFKGSASIIRPFSDKTAGSENDIKIIDLGPPDHLDAVKFERDGHLNAEFHQEIFLGEDKHHFQDFRTREEQIIKLEEIFHRADLDRDNQVNETELQKWIILMVNNHMKQATKQSEEKFKIVDLNRDGKVEFDEFNQAFFERIRRKDFHSNEDREKYIQDCLITIKKEWLQADINDDDILSKDEFLFFQHPEMSNRTLDAAVKEFALERDFDEDGNIDLKEFAFGFPLGDVNIADYIDGNELLMDKAYQFTQLLDKNGDGFGDINELKVYMDPFSSVNARNDAHDMIIFVDLDLDGKLSLEEIKFSSSYLTGSKLYDASLYFHREL